MDAVQGKDEALVVYFDDNGEQVETWVKIIEITQTYVSFYDTKNNTIIIPIHRVLKIKRRAKEDNSNE